MENSENIYILHKGNCSKRTIPFYMASKDDNE
jgi:hypothetical protein